MSDTPDIVSCVIALYPEVQRSAVHGLTELANTANQLAPPGRPRIEVSTCELMSRTPRHRTNYTVVVLPPCLSTSPPSLLESHPAIEWLKHCHRRGSLICSVCSGSFVLAETGLLDGRSATTHWSHEAAFKEKFPQIKLQFNRLIDHHGDVMTAGGVMAWTDLGLELIERFHGTQTMRDVSRLFLIEPGRRQQSCYTSFVPKRNHGDDEILQIQRLMEKQLDERWGIANLAYQAQLNERTFLRRFKRSTGLNPTQYLQQLRVAEARVKLENSNSSVEQIAYQVGYTDTPAFSRIFKRTVGLSPGVYRKRFSLSHSTPSR